MEKRHQEIVYRKEVEELQKRKENAEAFQKQRELFEFEKLRLEEEKRREIALIRETYDHQMHEVNRALIISKSENSSLSIDLENKTRSVVALEAQITNERVVGNDFKVKFTEASGKLEETSMELRMINEELKHYKSKPNSDLLVVKLSEMKSASSNHIEEIEILKNKCNEYESEINILKLEIQSLKSEMRRGDTVEKATEDAQKSVEHGVARKLVAQEQLIKQLDYELHTANAAQVYLESIQKRITDDNKLALERSVHWEDRAKAAEMELERLCSNRLGDLDDYAFNRHRNTPRLTSTAGMSAYSPTNIRPSSKFETYFDDDSRTLSPPPPPPPPIQTTTNTVSESAPPTPAATTSTTPAATTSSSSSVEPSVDSPVKKVTRRLGLVLPTTTDPPAATPNETETVSRPMKEETTSDPTLVAPAVDQESQQHSEPEPTPEQPKKNEPSPAHIPSASSSSSESHVTTNNYPAVTSRVIMDRVKESHAMLSDRVLSEIHLVKAQINSLKQRDMAPSSSSSISSSHPYKHHSQTSSNQYRWNKDRVVDDSSIKHQGAPSSQREDYEEDTPNNAEENNSNMSENFQQSDENDPSLPPPPLRQTTSTPPTFYPTSAHTNGQRSSTFRPSNPSNYPSNYQSSHSTNRPRTNDKYQSQLFSDDHMRSPRRSTTSTAESARAWEERVSGLLLSSPRRNSHLPMRTTNQGIYSSPRSHYATHHSSPTKHNSLHYQSGGFNHPPPSLFPSSSSSYGYPASPSSRQTTTAYGSTIHLGTSYGLNQQPSNASQLFSQASSTFGK